MNIDPANQPVWLVLLILLGTAVGFLLTKGIDALLRWRADSRIDTTYRDEQTKAGYIFTVNDLKLRVERAEATVVALHKEHLQCTEALAGFRKQAEMQQAEINRLEARVEELEAKA